MSNTEEPTPSYLTPATPALNQRVDWSQVQREASSGRDRCGAGPGRRYSEVEPAGFDPLRLCVFSTVALLTCIFGPVSLLFFSLLAIRGYARARRAGLMRSKCKLGDTRTVIAYLTVLAVLSVAAIPFWIMALMKVFS